MYLYREFGGSLWIRDSRQRLATEISDRAPALALMKQLQGKIVDCLFLLYSLTSPVEAIWIWVGLIYILHLLFCFIIVVEFWKITNHTMNSTVCSRYISVFTHPLQ